MSHKINIEELLFELYIAEEDARKHKSKKPYVRNFEENLHENLSKLADGLYKRTYEPEPSVCFIINDPKKREVFAAMFRDRIVHHLYFNLTHELFERTFIHDTYSCIKGRGTHFGIDRMYNHILKETENYTKECYVLKMDIRGYFMHIDRNLLLQIAINTLEKQRMRKISKNSDLTFDDVLDFDFIFYLTKKLVLLDPKNNCRFRSKKSEWNDLPSSKSLFNSMDGYGLPIGNLTSQLFSNVYMNLLDQYCKRVLKCKHYGRYVDDFYIVSKSKKRLHELIPLLEAFLENELHLEVNKGKTKVLLAKQGVEFLGTFLKYHRKYISNDSLNKIKKKIDTNERIKCKNGKNTEMSINSYLGLFGHCSSYNIRKEIFSKAKILNYKGVFNSNYTKYFGVL